MGEVFQYHITMLVNHEQENAIRKLFIDKDWTCWLNVISDQTVADVSSSGYDFFFTNINETNNKSIIKSEGMEITSEVINKDYKMEIDSAEEPSLYSMKTPKGLAIDIAEIKHEIATEHIGENVNEISKDAKSNKDVIKRCDISTSNAAIPISCATTSINDFMSELKQLVTPVSSSVISALDPPMASSSAVPSKGVPASGLKSDFVEHNLLKPLKVKKNSQRYPQFATVTKGVSKKGYIKDLITKIKNNRNFEKEGRQLTNVNEGDNGGRKKKKEKGKNTMYSKQPGSAYCPDCKEEFSTLEKLWTHRNEVKHQLPNNKPQGYAKRRYSREELLKMGFLSCSECNYLFQNKRKLRQHMFANHKEILPNPVCPICGEEFEGYRDLYRHKREKQHIDSISQLKSYQCETCGKYITKYDNFKRHKELSCSKSEAELKALHKHPCEICGKLFKSVKQAQLHKTAVHEQEESVCDICGKVLKTKIALRSHKRMHFEKNRKFVCIECGKSFFTVAILKQHERVHTKEKPFKCPLCEYTSSIAGNIKKHCFNVHKETLKPIDLRELNKNVT